MAVFGGGPEVIQCFFLLWIAQIFFHFLLKDEINHISIPFGDKVIGTLSWVSQDLVPLAGEHWDYCHWRYMRLASSENKNVIRSFLLSIYVLLLKLEIWCVVQGNSMKKYIIKFLLHWKDSNKILSHTGQSAPRTCCDPEDFRCTEQKPSPDCAGPAWSPACSWGSCSAQRNPHSGKSLKLVIDCVHGAVPFMSQCTIYAVKVSHMVCSPQRGGVLIIKDELEVQCRALIEKWKRSKLQDGFGISRVLSSFTEHCGEEQYIL